MGRTIVISFILALGGLLAGEAPAMSADEAWPPPFDGRAYDRSGAATALTGRHATYNVGPGQAYGELTEVPWLSLVAGDVVNVFHREAPYATLIGLRARGTAAMPVTINGVTDPATGRRPVITGAGAVQAADARAAGFAPDLQGSGVIKVFRSPTDDGSTYKAAYISIRNLEITGARAGNTYYGYDGRPHPYDSFAAGIYVVRADHLLVENCEVVGNGLGIFTNARGQSDIDFTSYVTLRANRFDRNGYEDSSFEHNIYVQARRVLYEGNYIGQARSGSSLKDRSSGTVVRFNHIVASARALDLVETEEEYVANLQADPLYHQAWVYGNTIVNEVDSPDGQSIRLVHWGFDNDLARGRIGTLHFYGNTIIHRGRSEAYWYVSAFQMGNNYGDMPPAGSGYRILAWDNVFINQGDDDGVARWGCLEELGTLEFRGVNLLPTGYLPTTWDGSGTVSAAGGAVMTGDPSAIDGSTFIPIADSAALGRGGSYTPDYAGIAAAAADFAPGNLVRAGEYAYQVEPSAIGKPVAGAVDIGARERPSGDAEAPAITAIAAAASASSATVTWTTDEPATGQVEYGLTAAYGSASPLSGGLATGHGLVLAGLAPATTYHFRVLSRDAAGNLATSADGTFATASEAGGGGATAEGGAAGGASGGSGGSGGCGAGAMAVFFAIGLGLSLQRRRRR